MGCLVHAELIEHISDEQVSHIIGFFNHNPGCSSVVLTRIPLIPLHPHVYEIMLQQLHSGARYVSLNSRHIIFTYHKYDPQCCCHSFKNLDDKEQCILWHMDPNISHNASNIWYEFLPCDGTHLYHLFNKSLGIDVTICPEQNLHNWLNPLSLHYNHRFAVWSSTTKHVHSRVNASKSVFPPQKWMQWHGNMPMGTNWFSMVHLVFAPHTFFYLLPWALMNTGKGFHWPLSYFQPLQETKQHVQATIRRSFVSFFTHGNHIFPMAKPHFFIPLLQSPKLTPKSRGPFKMSGQLFGGCSVSFIFDNVGPIVTRNWSLGRILIFGSSMYVEGHSS